MKMNSVNLTGRLTKDVELRMTDGGKAFARFTVAVDRGLSKEKKDEAKAKGYATADFIPVVVWGKSAENCARFTGKGKLVAVQGRLQTGSYEKDGVKHYTTDVLASNVEFLEWGEKKDDLEAMGYIPRDEDIPF